MEKSALFFDIDGTILSDVTGEVPESTIEALTKAKENGHLVFVNTGRTYCSIPPQIMQLPFDGYLCGCGIQIIYGDEVLLNEHLSEKHRENVLKKAKECNIEGLYEGEDDIFFYDRTSRYERLESTRRYMNRRGLGLERYLEQGGCAYDKMFVYTDEQSNSEDFFAYISDFMDILDRGNHTYECIVKGYTKATAIDFVLDHLQIDKNNAYAFGDSSNDRSMLESVTHAVVMQVHDPVLEPYAEFITTAVEDDGIWHAMKHYHLI